MAKPQIFVSSTFFDLKYIRASLDQFIESLGYEAVLSEKGNIAYNPDLSLDESCYREACNADVFVLIVGGRYGSPASDEDKDRPKDFYERYESITKKEYEAAADRDVPIYILIERSVYNEYETFKRNRENQEIKYAHVESVNVFRLIDEILSRPRNNPLYQFDRHTEIEAWLREQWAGLFKEMLSKRSEQRQLSTLADQAAELSNVNTTLKRYLEEVMSGVTVEKAAEIISDEEARLAESRMLTELANHISIVALLKRGKLTIDEARRIFTDATSLDDLATRIDAIPNSPYKAASMLVAWQEDEDSLALMNEVRAILNLPPLTWESKPADTGESE